MKVLVNGCYGGFSLSTRATKKLIEMGSELVSVRDEKEILDSPMYDKPGAYNLFFKWEDIGDGYEGNTALVNYVRKDGKIYLYEDSPEWNHEEKIYIGLTNPERRCHPDLIKVVEEMGEEANGTVSDLAFVEVPDDVKWHIEEYDGKEWVAEDHEVWYPE